MKKLILNLLLAILLLNSTSVLAQTESLNVDSLFHLKNKIKNAETLNSFYSKIQECNVSKSKLKIVHLGDSHIEMGYFVEEMRRGFKMNMPLAGFGMLFPYQLAKSIPYFVKSKSIVGTWEGKCYLKSESDYKFGLAGFTIKNASKHSVFEMQPVKSDSSILYGNEFVMYYSADDSAKIMVSGFNWSLDSLHSLNATCTNIETINDLGVTYKKAKFHFESIVNKLIVEINQDSDSVPFYISGVMFTNSNSYGLEYNNCGVVGATFKQLNNNASLSVAQLKDINPDLIIFSYGSNEAYEPKFDELEYYNAVSAYIQKVKHAMPSAPIVITTPPDTRAGGRYPVNNKVICQILEKVADENKVGFWDLRELMGGDGSMIKWFNLGLASKDKLHFKKAGYELQADMFLDALFNGYSDFYSNANKLISPIYEKNFLRK